MPPRPFHLLSCILVVLLLSPLTMRLHAQIAAPTAGDVAAAVAGLGREHVVAQRLPDLPAGLVNGTAVVLLEPLNASGVGDISRVSATLVRGSGESWVLARPRLTGGGDYRLRLEVSAPGVPTWSTVLEERHSFADERWEVCLVIDASASVKGNDPRNLRAAAITRFWELARHSRAIERLSLVVFRDDAKVVLPPTPPAAITSMDEVIAKIKPGATTNFDAAFGTTAEMFAAEPAERDGTTRRRAVLFLSDGEHIGRYLRGHLKMRDIGCPVYTIGLSKDADAKTLQTIARETGGQFYPAPTADELEPLFVKIFQLLEAPREVVRQVRAVPAGGATVSLRLDPSIFSPMLTVASLDGRLGVTLPPAPAKTSAPPTTAVTAVDSGGPTAVEAGTSVTLPLTGLGFGEQAVHLDGPGKAVLEVLASTDLWLGTMAFGSDGWAGDGLALAAYLGGDDRATDIVVRAVVTAPDGTTRDVTLARGEGGVYRADVPTDAAGVYQAAVVATGTFGGAPWRRETPMTWTRRPGGRAVAATGERVAPTLGGPGNGQPIGPRELTLDGPQRATAEATGGLRTTFQMEPDAVVFDPLYPGVTQSVKAQILLNTADVAGPTTASVEPDPGTDSRVALRVAGTVAAGQRSPITVSATPAADSAGAGVAATLRIRHGETVWSRPVSGHVAVPTIEVAVVETVLGATNANATTTAEPASESAESEDPPDLRRVADVTATTLLTLRLAPNGRVPLTVASDVQGLLVPSSPLQVGPDAIQVELRLPTTRPAIGQPIATWSGVITVSGPGLASVVVPYQLEVQALPAEPVVEAAPPVPAKSVQAASLWWFLWVLLAALLIAILIASIRGNRRAVFLLVSILIHVIIFLIVLPRHETKAKAELASREPMMVVTGDMTVEARVATEVAAFTSTASAAANAAGSEAAVRPDAATPAPATVDPTSRDTAPETPAAALPDAAPAEPVQPDAAPVARPSLDAAALAAAAAAPEQRHEDAVPASEAAAQQAATEATPAASPTATVAPTADVAPAASALPVADASELNATSASQAPAAEGRDVAAASAPARPTVDATASSPASAAAESADRRHAEAPAGGAGESAAASAPAEGTERATVAVGGPSGPAATPGVATVTLDVAPAGAGGVTGDGSDLVAPAALNGQPGDVARPDSASAQALAGPAAAAPDRRRETGSQTGTPSGPAGAAPAAERGAVATVNLGDDATAHGRATLPVAEAAGGVTGGAALPQPSARPAGPGQSVARPASPDATLDVPGEGAAPSRRPTVASGPAVGSGDRALAATPGDRVAPAIAATPGGGAATPTQAALTPGVPGVAVAAPRPGAGAGHAPAAGVARPTVAVDGLATAQPLPGAPARGAVTAGPAGPANVGPTAGLPTTRAVLAATTPADRLPLAPRDIALPVAAAPGGPPLPGGDVREPPRIRLNDANGRAARGKWSHTLPMARYGGDWDCDVTAMPNLAHQLEQRTGSLLPMDSRAIDLSSPELPETPFVFMSGHSDFALQPAEVSNLTTYLKDGGYLWINDSTDLGDMIYDAAVRREFARVLPGAEWRRIPANAPLFQGPYDLTKGYMGYAVPPGDKYRLDYLEGLWIGDRLAVVYTRNDYGDGLEIDPHTHPLMSSLSDLSPEDMQEGSVRMGINIVTYFLNRGAPVPAGQAALVADSRSAAERRHDEWGGKPVLPTPPLVAADKPWQRIEGWDDLIPGTLAQGDDGNLTLHFDSAGRAISRRDKMIVSLAAAQSFPRDRALRVQVDSQLRGGARLALAINTAGGTYLESAPVFLKPGANADLVFDLRAATFKSAATEWRYEASLPENLAISDLYLVLYPQEGVGTVVLKRLEYVQP